MNGYGAKPSDFYVHPGADLGPGLQGLAQTMMQATEQRRQRQAQQDKIDRYAQMKAGAIQAWQQYQQTGDIDKLLEFGAANPEIGDTLNKMYKMQTGLKDADAEKQLREYNDALFSWMQNPTEEGAQAILDERKDLNIPGAESFMEVLRGDPEKARRLVEGELAWRDKDRMKSYLDQMGGGGISGLPADVKTFDYLTSGLTDDEKARAKRVKLGLSPRASEDAVSKAMKAMAVETAKLQARLGLEPQVAGAVAAAKNQAKIEADETSKQKTNETAWNVYDSSMSNLAKAMGETRTGPVSGFIPAITTNQQVAEGAVAVMAPVLKQMFRASGEGTFTDQDQKMLMNMIPTRKDTPDARVAKIKAIDDVVRSKLGKYQPVGEKEDIAVEQTEQVKNVSEMSDEELLRALGK